MSSRILKLLSPSIRYILSNADIDYKRLVELRLRINEPFILVFSDGEILLGKKGGMTKDKEAAYRVSAEDIRTTVDAVSDHSLYAYEDDIRQGFITIRGGHRVGIAGQVVLEKGRVKNVKHISFINI